MEERKMNYFNLLNTINLFIIITSFVLSLCIAYKIYRYPFKQHINYKIDARYQGIDGWLILILFILAYDTFYQGSYLILYTLSAILSADVWRFIPESGYLKFILENESFVLFMSILTIYVSVFYLSLFVMFFNKKRIFPKFYIFVIFSDFVLNILNDVVLCILSDTVFTGNGVRSLICVLILASYIHCSKRVRSTFIND